MPKVYPIENRGWVVDTAGKLLKRMYGEKRLGFRLLPSFNITPEFFAKSTAFDVEFMLALLASGAWIEDEWQPYVRYTIAKRLRVRSNELFDGVIAHLKDDFLEFQLEGGGFKAQTTIRNAARAIVNRPETSRKHKAVGRLMLSTLDDIQFNTLVQPFHWIRLSYALSENDVAFSMSLYATEMSKQKTTLCAMLRAK